MAVQPSIVAPLPSKPAWILASGSYYGNINGPAASHGGVNASERQYVKIIQQYLIYHGCVDGVSDYNSSWADGVWEGPTDTAMALWHARFYPNQTYPLRCYRDDYDRL